jgi:hypothetical protein
LRWSAPDEGVRGYTYSMGYTKAGGYTKHVQGYALWRWAMTFVTLSLRYAPPRIGVGSEFCALVRALPKRFLKEKFERELEMDSRSVCVI